ncbi:helix-turn-helix domain-containing protein [Acidovorax sp. sif1233]|uniref:helix-turn-helix domain-containing protein n=1 Tax=Acidovorax sp. sif1233 TaxID=2854792 RepID=UPI001C45FEF0|nr:helix-turn-helix domain-containing protein [Acidovorax sp. sif1233]MBV7455123.1 helix-turn-helix domain-containing protein [Acidovorax sp. sif1233]
MRSLSSWSSENLPESMRLRGWRDALHAEVLEMDALPLQRDGFFGSIERCTLHCILPHQARGAPQKVLRSAAEIARGPRNAYYLLSQPQLPWRAVHVGRTSILQPGDSILIDSREPYEFDFGVGLDDLSVELPIDWVERWLPEPSRLIGRPLRGDAGWGLALRGIKEALVPRGLVDRPCSQDELIEDQLGGLLSLLDDVDGAQRPAMQVAYERSLQVMRARFMQPGLTAAEVAADAGLSLRTLHRAMAAQGQGYLTTLMTLRVEAAAGLLAQPRFRRLGVGEIGRRCGFTNASHFARQFHRQRQMTPQAFRAHALR